MDAHSPVAILPPEVSRRIAAGEVIERPASVVRELIDNSLDAGATSVDITWSGGGAEELRVRDDGDGMSRADLELCWKAHATSKIRTIDDLDHATSLGFRGEALSSVAAVSELGVSTARRGEASGHRLQVRHAQLISLDPAPPLQGTTVSVRQLFANLPARRRFLSRPQAETNAIRNVIMDKALPFPEVRFTHHGGSGKARVLPMQSLVERVASTMGSQVPVQSLHQLQGSGEGFRITLVAAEPAIVRRDRRLIPIFVNRRRVWEYKLVQAVEYAYQDVQHGGLFPVTAVLVEIDPALADFNIHPAKREVRLRVSGEIHHRIVELLRQFLRSWAVKAASLAPHDLGGDRTWFDQVAERPSSAGSPPRPAPPPHRPGEGRAHFDHQTRAIPDHDQLVYRGTLFGTFIVVERGDHAWIIDQHAAHERLLYDRFAAARSSQQLLVPDEFEVTQDQDISLGNHRQDYLDLGIRIDRLAPRRWQLAAMPAEYRENSETLIETILELGGLEESLDRKFMAEMACKAALKAGDYLDDMTAVQLAERTLALEKPRCPHGRPLFIELTQERLEELIGRR